MAIELPIKTSTATYRLSALRRAEVLHQYDVGTCRMNVLRPQDLERAFSGFQGSGIAAPRRGTREKQRTVTPLLRASGRPPAN